MRSSLLPAPDRWWPVWLLAVVLLVQACGSDSKTGPTGATQIRLNLQSVSRAQIPANCTGVLMVTGGEGSPVSATVPPDGVVRLMLTPGPHTFTVTLTCDGRIFTGRQDADVVSGQPLNLTMRVTVSDVCGAQQPQRRRGEQGGRALAFLEPLWPDALRRVVSLAGWPESGSGALAAGPAGVMVAQGNPVPSIASIVPDFAAPGSGPTPMVVFSSGFDFITTPTPSVIQWTNAGGVTTPLTTTFVNATQLSTTIPAALLASPGTATVTVFNPAPGGGTSNGVTFTITSTNPVPFLFTLTPNFAAPGGPGFTLVVTGNNFVSTSAVNWNGAPRTTTFINSTQVSASIPASDIATPGTASVTVVNPAPGGGTSNALTFTITGTNPVPVLFTLTPNFAAPGGPGFTLVVTGSNFVSGSVVRWNGAARPTTFTNSTQVSASIPASDIAAPGTASVTVVNPAPGGGTSNALTFTITSASPVPEIFTLTPPSATAGGDAFTMTVTGQNFTSGAVVRWNGSDRPTAFENSTQLRAAISALDIANPTTAQVTVVNPPPGGGTSNALPFTVCARGR